MNAAAAARVLAGWVYPPCCAGCDAPVSLRRHGEFPFLCEECERALVPMGEGCCRVCGQRYEAPAASLFSCANCAGRELAVDFALGAYRAEGPARVAVHRLKYGRDRAVARLLGRFMDALWSDERLRGRAWRVVPVPLHPRRMRERGFNQAREIAVEFIKRAPPGVELTLWPVLRRVRHTGRQARLDREERLRNLSGAFRVKRWRRRPPGGGPLDVLLVDDVLTTAATVSECAAVLRDAYEPDTVAAVAAVRG